MPNFKEFQSAMNDELSLPYGLGDWLSFINAQTRAEVKAADEAVAFKDRVVASFDSVPAILVPVIEG